MGLLTNLFGSKSKKSIAKCNVCQSHMEANEGYALNTAQIVVSKVFWDHKMVEPETMSYTTSHFKNGDQNATNMRRIIFEKTAEKEMTWLTCETCITKFDVSLEETKQLADQWWSREKEYNIPNAGKAIDQLQQSDYDEMRQYATMEAGATLIRI